MKVWIVEGYEGVLGVYDTRDAAESAALHYNELLIPVGVYEHEVKEDDQ